MTDSLEYTVLRREGKLELREYPAMVMVGVDGLSDNEAFGVLFRYISGDNTTRRRIQMTAPVISSKASGEKIPMTAPVVSSSSYFAFVLPKGYSADDSPEPIDPRARLMPVQARKVAVLRFRGYAWKSIVRAKTERLMSLVDAAGLRTVGEPFLMRYNPPITPWLLRRNEVAVGIAD